MADRSDRLRECRQLDSRTKAARVLAALDAMVASGTAISMAALARHANVSRRFIYDHPELRAEAERRSAQIIEAHSAAMAATARVSLASLRADLANANATNHRLMTELAGLRRRLGQLLGQEILQDLPDKKSSPDEPKSSKRPARSTASSSAASTVTDTDTQTSDGDAHLRTTRQRTSGGVTHTRHPRKGHSSIRMTKDVYGHLLGGETQAAAASISNVLYGPVKLRDGTAGAQT